MQPRPPISIIVALVLSALLGATPSALAAPVQGHPSDTAAILRAINDALEKQKTGARLRWNGGDGRYGFITITRTWFPNPSTPCRDYTRSLHQGSGRSSMLRGTGCRADDQWLLLETNANESGSARSSSRNSSTSATAAKATPTRATPTSPSKTGRSKKSASTGAATPKSKPRQTSPASQTNQTSSATRAAVPGDTAGASSDPAADAALQASLPTAAD